MRTQKFLFSLKFALMRVGVAVMRYKSVMMCNFEYIDPFPRGIPASRKKIVSHIIVHSGVYS